jgi:hypothetical protein
MKFSCGFFRARRLWRGVVVGGDFSPRNLRPLNLDESQGVIQGGKQTTRCDARRCCPAQFEVHHNFLVQIALPQ